MPEPEEDFGFHIDDDTPTAAKLLRSVERQSGE
jgi:hypothetical protein